MGDGGAACERRGTHRGGRMGVHPDPLAKGLGFSARGVDLVVAERLPAALPNALGGKNLDDVGAVGDGLADMGADLVERQAGVVRSEERRVGKECRSRWSPYH